MSRGSVENAGNTGLLTPNVEHRASYLPGEILQEIGELRKCRLLERDKDDWVAVEVDSEKGLTEIDIKILRVVYKIKKEAVSVLGKIHSGAPIRQGVLRNVVLGLIEKDSSDREKVIQAVGKIHPDIDKDKITFWS